MEREDRGDAHYRPEYPSSYEGGGSGYDDTPGYRGSPYPPPVPPTPAHGVPTYGAPTYGAPVPEEPRWNWGSGGGTRYAGDEESSRELIPVRPTSRTRPDPDDEDEDDDRKARPRGRRDMPLWQELPLLLVVAFCLAVLIRTFLLQAFFIPSGSMMDTLLVGDRVLVNKIVYDVRTPERGEVIVFRGSANWESESGTPPAKGLVASIGRTIGDLVGLSRPGEKDFIKRVIGIPGDRVSCCDVNGNVIVNGQGLIEPYVLNNSALDAPKDPKVCRSRQFDEVLVPAGQLFVMGDHRIVSQDSRCKGPIPIENVIGKAFVIVWPSDRWNTLDMPDTFDNVPGPVALPYSAPMKSAPHDRPWVPVTPELATGSVSLPILASFLISARTGRKRRCRPRTLRA